MILLPVKQAGVSALVVFLALSTVVVKSNKYSKNIRKNGSCTGEFCEVKDEYDEPCMDEGHKGDPGVIEDEPSVDDKDEQPEDEQSEDETEEFDYPKEGLYRWDPVKASTYRAGTDVVRTLNFRIKKTRIHIRLWLIM